MERDRIERIERICYRAMTSPAAERPALLDRLCGDDPELRHEVESLLTADERAGAFLDRPILQTLAPPPAAGSRIGPYQLQRVLGEGGMSVVFLAVRCDDEYRQRVALKIVGHGPATGGRLRRFRAERQILARLEHPNIARLLDGGTTAEGLPYFVMELVDGEPIDRYCDRHRLRVADRVRLFRDVCAAVHFAHRNLVVHRDLKPSNILITAEGDVKLLDFGIAKLLAPEPGDLDLHPTDTGLRAMTPEFASPEQLLGQPVTTASDVYTLGVVLYQLLTGHLPHRVEGRSPSRQIRAVLAAEAPRPSAAVGLDGAGSETDSTEAAGARGVTPGALARLLRLDLDFVVQATMRLEPERRYASVAQLDEDLDRYLSGLPVRARRGKLLYLARKLLRRHRVAAAAAAGFLAAVLAFAGALHRQADQAAAERDRAEEAIRFVEQMLSAGDPATGPGEAATLRDALERGLQQLTELQGHPLLRARLEHFLGSTFLNLGESETAAELLRAALDTRRLQLDEHPDVVATLVELGYAHIDGGQYEQATALLTEARDLSARLFAHPHAQIADSLVALGWALELNGDFAAAEQQQRAALEMRLALFGDNDPAVADSLRALGGVRWQRGDDRDGESYYRRALTILEQTLGSEHPEVASVLNDLGVLLQERGDLHEAEPLLRRSIEVKRLRLGDHHPMVLNTRGTLAVVLRRKGELEAAETMARQVLAARIAALGEGHPAVVQSLLAVANILTERERPREARELFARALRVARASLGPGHPITASVLTGFGRLELRAGEGERAEALLREAISIQSRALPSDHRDLVRSRWLLGAALASVGSHR